MKIAIESADEMNLDLLGLKLAKSLYEKLAKEGYLQKIVDRFKRSVNSQLMRQEALVNYEIDEYDER